VLAKLISAARLKWLSYTHGMYKYLPALGVAYRLVYIWPVFRLGPSWPVLILILAKF